MFPQLIKDGPDAAFTIVESLLGQQGFEPGRPLEGAPGVQYTHAAYAPLHAPPPRHTSLANSLMLRHRGTTVQVEAFMLDADTHLPNAILVPHDQNMGGTKVRQ